MNKTFLVFALVASFVMASCGGPKKEEEKKEEAEEAYQIAQPEKAPAEDAIAEGKALVDGSDCRACHHPDNKIVGPAHKEVAKKYEFTETNVKYLAKKIIEGGSGVWGDVMMAPHPNVSQADAEKMARYVLSLDGEKEH